ncbi:hypothetical protein MAR_036574 [Mya arenaria]|uniref:Uncharacterized protein n=1 Tax=Mya arenaria TaxID=6604 RepID=A0ABY7FLH6_MYAAR|nr:hypothetical protein MAR_036574 [Mya arenaria]
MRIIDLFGLEVHVAVEKNTPAIQILAKHLFHCKIETSDLQTNSDGTSRRKRKIFDTAITLDNGEIVSLGFKRVVSETASKINDSSKEDTKTTVLQFHCMTNLLLGFHRYACEDLKHEEKSLAADEPIAGDHLGLRDRWESHCAAKGIKFLIGNYRANRFNGLFQTSAVILYHLSEFLLVIKTVKRCIRPSSKRHLPAF